MQQMVTQVVVSKGNKLVRSPVCRTCSKGNKLLDSGSSRRDNKVIVVGRVDIVVIVY